MLLSGFLKHPDEKKKQNHKNTNDNITCKPRESIRQAKLILYVQLVIIYILFTRQLGGGVGLSPLMGANLHCTVQLVLRPRMAAAAGKQKSQSPASPTAWSYLSSQTAKMTVTLLPA